MNAATFSNQSFAKGGVSAALISALVAGLLLRTAWAALVPVIPVSDGIAYDAFARSIVEGGGYSYPDGTPTAWWPVGTSATYALLYLLFGTSPVVIVLFNVGLGLALIWLTWSLAQRHFGRTVANGAAWITACWPLMIQLTTVLASELLFVVLLLAVLLIWSHDKPSGVLRTVAWATVLTLAVYVRPQALPLYLLLPALQAVRARSWRVAVVSVLVAATTAAALLTPWVLRNDRVIGGPVLVSTNFGTNFWMGNNPLSDGGYMPLPVPDTPFASEVERNRHFAKLSYAWVVENPLGYLRLCAARLVMTHDRETVGVAWNAPGIIQAFGPGAVRPLKLVSTVYWLILALAALAGVAMALRRRLVRPIDPMLLVPAMFFAIAVLTVGQDRYHVPLNPFVAMFAAMSLSWLAARTRASLR